MMHRKKVLKYNNLGFCLPSSSALDLIYPGQNRGVKEIIKNLIDWF